MKIIIWTLYILLLPSLSLAQKVTFENYRAKADRCLEDKNYSCAIQNYERALRIRENDTHCSKGLQKAKQWQKAATQTTSPKLAPKTISVSPKIDSSVAYLLVQTDLPVTIVINDDSSVSISPEDLVKRIPLDIGEVTIKVNPIDGGADGFERTMDVSESESKILVINILAQRNDIQEQQKLKAKAIEETATTPKKVEVQPQEEAAAIPKKEEIQPNQEAAAIPKKEETQPNQEVSATPKKEEIQPNQEVSATPKKEEIQSNQESVTTPKKEEIQSNQEVSATPKKEEIQSNQESVTTPKKEEIQSQIAEINKTEDAILEAISSNMILVTGGEFKMGDKDQKPVHKVTLRDFYMGKYEVTQQQWQAVMGNPAELKDENCSDCPVAQISWEEVQEFIQKLNKRTGLTYRLPTEAEWEYAARGGQKSKRYTYSGTNSVEDAGWYQKNSLYKTHPVGQKKANELDLYDMTGNVWEWCQDWFSEDYYTYSPDFVPVNIIPETNRVIRGGAADTNVLSTKTTNRGAYKPDTKSVFIGFRIVRD